MNCERAGTVLAALPDADAFVDRVASMIDQNADHMPVSTITEAWLEALKELYEQNVPRVIPSEPPQNTLEHARWRDTVNALCTPPEISQMAATLTVAFIEFTKSLPSIAKGPYQQFGDSEETNTVSLVDVADLLDLVDKLTFSLITAPASILFPRLRDQFQANVMRISGNPKSPDKVIFPRNYKGDDPLAYLTGTPLLRIFSARVPIKIPEEARYMGHWICAPSGKGKTTLLLSMLLKDMERDASIILMDSKGELSGEVKQWASIKDRLVVIEPEEAYPLQLNPLDTKHTSHTISLLEYLFSSLLDAKMTALQSTLFRSALRATLCLPNPTIEIFRSIIKNGVMDAGPLPADLREFFESEFPTKTYSETRQQIQWRLRLLMENPVIRGMFTARKSLLDIGDLMNSRKVVVINNSKALLGDEGSEFFGRFFLALVYGEAIQRSHLRDDQKRPVFVYIDEAQTVIRRDEKVAAIIDECRSQKIALIVAHQRANQLEPFVADALANCGIRMANSEDDAAYLAPKLRTTSERLRTLPTGTFATVVRDYGSFELAVARPGKLAHMSAAEQEALKDEMRQKYCAHTYISDSVAERTQTSWREPSTEPTKDL